MSAFYRELIFFYYEVLLYPLIGVMDQTHSLRCNIDQLKYPMSLAQPIVRKATIHDFDKVYPLLKKIRQDRADKAYWQNLFTDHWHFGEFSPGIILQSGDDIVGFLATIYSRQQYHNKPQLFCNLSSWIVDEAYRSYSFMMLLPLLKEKKMVLTSYTSNDISYAIYHKLNFQDGNTHQRIVYASPSLRHFFNADAYQIIVDADAIQARLNEHDRQVYVHHQSFHTQCYLITYQNTYCLIMGERVKTMFHVYSVSDCLFLQQHISRMRNQLIHQMQVKSLLINENCLNNKALFLSRKVQWGLPYQYKTHDPDIVDPSPVYSELFLLKM